MQLNEIIEENTLESISQKTRLSSENLEKLFARDFGAFRKVQALGFISILEREYRADLSDLRAECLAYFSEKPPVENAFHEIETFSEKPPIIDTRHRRKIPSFIKPTLIGLIVLGLLYGAWQTLASSSADETNITRGEESGWFASIVQQAKTWMAGESNASDAGALPEATRGAWEHETNTTQTALVIAKTPQTSDADTQSDQADRKTEHNENEIIRKVKAQQSGTDTEHKTAELETMLQVDNAIAEAANDISEPEKPLSPEVPSVAQAGSGEHPDTNAAAEAAAKVVAAATSKPADEEAAQQKAAETARLKAEAEKAAAEEAAREQAAAEEAARLQAEKERRAAEEAAREKAAAEEAARRKAEQERKAAQAKAAKEKAAREKAAKLKAAREKAAREKAAKEKAAAKGKIVIRPRAKIWIGKVNLATMQRSTVTTAKPFALDNLKGRWIIATGHGRFSLKIGSRVFNFDDSKKHFLIIQKGTAHEIPHATFQKLNKSKVW